MVQKFSRKRKEAMPVLAVCYDFDRTLSPEDMQAQGYIQSIGYEVESSGKNRMRLPERTEWIPIWRTCTRWCRKRKEIWS